MSSLAEGGTQCGVRSQSTICHMDWQYNCSFRQRQSSNAPVKDKMCKGGGKFVKTEAVENESLCQSLLSVMQTLQHSNTLEFRAVEPLHQSHYIWNRSIYTVSLYTFSVGDQSVLQNGRPYYCNSLLCEMALKSFPFSLISTWQNSHWTNCNHLTWWAYTTLHFLISCMSIHLCPQVVYSASIGTALWESYRTISRVSH